MNNLSERPADPWYALQVRSGREAYVENLLESKGHTVYCPTLKALARAAQKRQRATALFPGYLFCRINMNNRMPVLGTTWVGSIVGVGRSPIAIPEVEIESLKTLVASAAEIQPHEYLNVGQKVRLTSGPLSGLEGIVSDLRSSYRVVVSISLLQRSVAAEIDACTVEPIDETGAYEHRLLHRRVA